VIARPSSCVLVQMSYIHDPQIVVVGAVAGLIPAVGRRFCAGELAWNQARNCALLSRVGTRFDLARTSSERGAHRPKNSFDAVRPRLGNRASS